MRFIHFADLHVDHYQKGKRGDHFSLRVYDMLAHVDLIIDQAVERQVDFVLFAGDMYHTHLPKPEIRAALHERLWRLFDIGIPMYAVPGNHDMTRRATAKDALYELTSLRVPGVHVFHEPGVVVTDAYSIAGIPWMHEPFDVSSLEYPTDRPCYAVAHTTVLGATTFGSGTDTSEVEFSREFTVPLEDLQDFDYVALGHIHKPQVVSTDPPIIYPGSVGLHSWGEAKDKEHYFVYYNEGEYEFIPYPDRPRYLYTLQADDPIPIPKEPEAFYKFMVPELYPVHEIELRYKDVYSLEIIPIRLPRVERRRLEQDFDELNKLSQEDLLRLYFASIGEDFAELEDLWYEVKSDVRT